MQKRVKYKDFFNNYLISIMISKYDFKSLWFLFPIYCTLELWKETILLSCMYSCDQKSLCKHILNEKKTCWYCIVFLVYKICLFNDFCFQLYTVHKIILSSFSIYIIYILLYIYYIYYIYIIYILKYNWPLIQVLA